MEIIFIILIIISVPLTIIIMRTITKKTLKVENELKNEIIDNKEVKDINKENNYYIENIAKDINSTKKTLKLFLIIYILPTIITLIFTITIIIKIENLQILK